MRIKKHWEKIKYTILGFFSVVAISFFIPEALPDNQHFEQILHSRFGAEDVIIIFNPGGWGYASLDEAGTFQTVIDGIKNTIEEWGYNVFVVPYNRTRDTLAEKIKGLKELNQDFENRSRETADQIENFLERNSKTKIVMAGVSNGGVFVDKVMEKISEETQTVVYAVEVGKPYQPEVAESANILRIENDQDLLAKGDLYNLTFTYIKGSIKWLYAKLTGNSELSFTEATYIPNHRYGWDSPKVGPQITDFLAKKVIQKK